MGEGSGPSPSSLANPLVRAAPTTLSLSWVLPSFGARGAALGLEDVAPRTLTHTTDYAMSIDAAKPLHCVTSSAFLTDHAFQCQPERHRAGRQIVACMNQTAHGASR